MYFLPMVHFGISSWNVNKISDLHGNLAECYGNFGKFGNSDRNVHGGRRRAWDNKPPHMNVLHISNDEKNCKNTPASVSDVLQIRGLCISCF